VRAFFYPEFGAPGVIGERPKPTAGEGEILVKVDAAAINAMDPNLGSGAYKDYMEHRLPLIPGSDYAGTVVAVGPGVSGIAIGDEVFGDTGKAFVGEGTVAEYVTVSAALAKPRPEGLSAEVAASLPRAGGTALAEVEAAGVQAGDTVLIVGAAGGVGSFAIQLAARRGARVIAATSLASSDSVRDLGADAVVDYAADDFLEQVRRLAPDGVSSLIDNYHDAAGLVPLAGLVRDGGAVASPVAMGGDQALADLPVTFHLVRAAVDRADELAEMAARGDLVVTVDAYPFLDTGSAIAQQATRSSRGKIVVTVG